MDFGLAETKGRLNHLKIRTRVRRIGITGSAQAGKTVFLLSLISHLETGDLKFDGEGTRRFRDSPIEPGPLSKALTRLPGLRRIFSERRAKFDYEGLRKHLAAKATWPGKTADCFFFRCRFQRAVKGAKWKNLWRPIARLSEDEVEFFDFPGERVADVTMIGRNYDEWSYIIYKKLTDDPTKATLAKPFIDTINQQIPERDAVLAAWKLALGKLVDALHALITPSTFLVDSQGNNARERVVALHDLKRTRDDTNEQAIMERIGRLREANSLGAGSGNETAEELAVAYCAGLPDEEFAPLPEPVRRRVPELAKRFEKRYESYQRKVIRPFATHLLSCHSLVFLVDLTDVLAAGMQRLNDTEDMVLCLLECIERGRGWFMSLLRGTVNVGRKISGGRWGFIDRIAFVASQADKIHPRDRDKMIPLLVDLVQKHVRNSGPGKVEYFTSSAVVSTEPMPGEERILVGRPMWIMEGGTLTCRPPTADPQQVVVSALPEHFPHDPWKAEDYQFPNFHPAIPQRHHEPPPLTGLDAVLKYVIDA